MLAMEVSSTLGVARDIHAPRPPVQGLKNVDIGEMIEPEFFVVTANLAQSRDAHQRRAISRHRPCPFIKPTECERNLLQPIEAGGGEQQPTHHRKRLNGTTVAISNSFRKYLGISDHAEREFIGEGCVLIQKQEPLVLQRLGKFHGVVVGTRLPHLVARKTDVKGKRQGDVGHGNRAVVPQKTREQKPSVPDFAGNT